MKVEKYIEILEDIFQFFPEADTTLDAILVVLFRHHIEDVRFILEEGELDQVIRTFRLIDVIDEAGIDTIVWLALNKAIFAIPILTIMREWDTQKKQGITMFNVLVALTNQLPLNVVGAVHFGDRQHES